jgi:RNA polymerase sigma-70 factor (ECF subfamily)
MMSAVTESRTDATLLWRVRDPRDPEAWQKFVTRYGPKIYNWCRRWGLQEADAQDVTQSVLVRLVQRMRTFTYDPTRSFRGWLHTVARSAWKDCVANRSGTISLEDIAEVADDLAAELNDEFDRELLELAIASVRVRVGPKTWEAFRLAGLERHPPRAIAADLGMSVRAVYQAKHRVKRLLQEELERLEQEAR